MAMLVVDSDAFAKELAKLQPNALENTGKVVQINRGRPTNRLEVPESLRQVIAEEAIENGHTAKIAESFGVSKSSVDAYKNDATSTASYNKPDTNLAKANDVVRDEIVTKARGKLTAALDALTEDKICEAKVKDIAGIAKDMSAIVKNMEPAVAESVRNTQVIVYKPRMRDEDEFEVITVNE